MPLKTIQQKRVVVDKSPENPEPDHVIADHVRRISEAMEKLDRGPLKRNAIVTLVHAHTGVRKNLIIAVLNCLGELRSIYLK
jgi:hypothetical protein